MESQDVPLCLAGVRGRFVLTSFFVRGFGDW